MVRKRRRHTAAGAHDRDRPPVVDQSTSHLSGRTILSLIVVYPLRPTVSYSLDRNPHELST